MELENNIPESWVETSIGELAELLTDYVANGSFASLKENVTYLRGGEGYARLIRLADHNKNYKGEAVFVNEHSYMFLKKSKLYPRDLIISNVGEYSGTLFRAPNLDIPMTLGPNSILLKFGESDDYMFYFLQGRVGKHLINTVKSGSANPKFNKTEFKKIEFIIPPLPEQKAIAKVLTSFDDKIELLQAQNKTLETMAQTIFKEWFGKYQIGDELPEGWRVGEITELFEVRDGTHDSPKETIIGKQLITSRHISKERIKFEDSYFISENDFKAINKRSKVDQYDILFSMIGTLGLTYLELNSNIDYAIKNLALFKTSQKKEYSIYTYLWLIGIHGKHYVLKNKSGSTQEFMSLGSLRNIEFIIPSVQTLSDFNSLCEPVYNKIKINSSQIQSLTKTRDTLLPKLMNGQVRVNNIKQLASA